MICDCGGVMVYAGERWECPECGASLDYEYSEDYDDFGTVFDDEI